MVEDAFTWTEARPTAAMRALLKPSSFSKAASRSRPSDLSTDAQISMLLRNVAFSSISSLPILGHWLPLPGHRKMPPFHKGCMPSNMFNGKLSNMDCARLSCAVTALQIDSG